MRAECVPRTYVPSIPAVSFLFSRRVRWSVLNFDVPQRTNPPFFFRRRWFNMNRSSLLIYSIELFSANDSEASTKYFYICAKLLIVAQIIAVPLVRSTSDWNPTHSRSCGSSPKSVAHARSSPTSAEHGHCPLLLIL